MVPIVTPSWDLMNQWLTPTEIAAQYNRSLRQVQNWCSNGTLREFGFQVMQSSDRSWWIRYPRTVSTKR